MSEKLGFEGDRDKTSPYNRPRRPNPDTITYLRGLPLDVESARMEISTFLLDGGDNNNSQEFPQSLEAALSAIDEIRNEIASLAGDELGSQCIETLARISAPYSETASRILLSACSGYHLHLATHRYGSHVIQSILQLAVSSSSDNDLGLHSEAPPFGSYVDSLPKLVDLILGMLEELQDSATQLAVHVCGSHVLRTLLCVLGGVELVASGPQGDKKPGTEAILRGRTKEKKKKKKKTQGAIEASAAGAHTGTMRIVYSTKSRLEGNAFSEQLASLAYALMGEASETPGELQQLACHPSAGPLLIVLLRVLTYSNPEDREIMNQQSSSQSQNDISDFRLGISRPEPTFQDGSVAHEMAKRLLCWTDGREKQTHFGDVIYGYSGEQRGSHVLETLLRVGSNGFYDEIVKYGDFENPSSLQEYCEHDVANFVIQTLLTSIRNKDQATRMLKAIEKVVSGGLAVDPTKRRRGILWRSCELAAKYRVGQETLMKSIRIGFGSLNRQNVDSEIAVGEPSKKKQRTKSTAIEIKDCIPLLLDLKMDKDESTRIQVDAAGARAIYHMLHFTPRLCEDILKGLVDELTSDEIESLARDGLGSRCILDGILEGPPNHASFASAFLSMLSKLKGRWTSIATDRVGHHSVKKLFHALPKMDDKGRLAEELASGGNRLQGNAMGRSVSEECMLESFVENRKDWRKAVTKSPHSIKEANLSETFIPKSKEEIPEGEGKSKRKRKRKHASKGGQPLNTDAIMEALIV